MKRTYKHRALKGDVAAVMAWSPSLSAAARRLGINRSTLHRWIQAGKVERITATDSTSPVVQHPQILDLPIPLSLVDEPIPAAIAALTGPERRTWLDLRREAVTACAGGPYDARHALMTSAATAESWRAQPRLWLQQHFNGDPRTCH